jgi:hypothetical protein
MWNLRNLKNDTGDGGDGGMTEDDGELIPDNATPEQKRKMRAG